MLYFNTNLGATLSRRIVLVTSYGASTGYPSLTNLRL